MHVKTFTRKLLCLCHMLHNRTGRLLVPDVVLHLERSYFQTHAQRDSEAARGPHKLFVNLKIVLSLTEMPPAAPMPMPIAVAIAMPAPSLLLYMGHARTEMALTSVSRG